MALLTAGYWATTYWPSSYWATDYWSEYGTAVAIKKPFFRFIPRRRLEVVFIDKEAPVTFEPKDTSFEDKPAPVFKE